MTPRSSSIASQGGLTGLLLAVLLFGGVSCSKESRQERKQEIITITLPPPPPPPPLPPKVEPPPPKEEPPEKEEMVEQEKVPDDEPPPEAPIEAPADDLLGTGIAGNGPDMGLGGGKGSGNRIGGGGRRGGGSKFGWYAAKVQGTIAEELRRNPSTKGASMSLQVRVWPDANGRITRVQLVGTSGSSVVDQAIKNQVLTGLQLPQAPPADMPLPIVLRITARKPGA